MEKTWGPPVSSGELLRSVWTGGTHGTGCIPYRHAQATAKIVSRKHATIPGTLQWFLLRVPRSTLVGTCWHHFALLSLSRNLSNCATSCAGSKQMWKFQKTGRGYPKNIHFMRIFKYQTNQLSSCWGSLISGTSQNKEAEVLNCHCPQLGSYSSL